MDDGRWSMGDGRWTMGDGRRATGDGRRATLARHDRINLHRPSSIVHPPLLAQNSRRAYTARPAVRTFDEVSALKSTANLPMTRPSADVAFGMPTDVAGVPAPVHRY